MSHRFQGGTKLVHQRRKVLVESYRAGLTMPLCAQRAAISLSSLYSWLSKGRIDRDLGKKAWPWDPKRENWEERSGKNLSKELDLLEAMDRAESDRLAEALLAIRAAGKGGEDIVTDETTERAPDGTVRTTRRTKKTAPDWKAFAWLAERTRSRDYGTFQRTEVSGPEGGPVQVTSLVDLIRKASQEEEEEQAKLKKDKE